MTVGLCFMLIKVSTVFFGCEAGGVVDLTQFELVSVIDSEATEAVGSIVPVHVQHSPLLFLITLHFWLY